MLNKVLDFINKDIWRIRRKDSPPTKFFFIKLLRVILLALRGFDEDKCKLRASALTFYSLLSVVPVFAMAFGIAKGFGFQKMLHEKLLTQFAQHKEVIVKIIDFSNSFLDNTQGGLIAGVGIAILFWTVIKVLGNIESSFNDIWGIKESRPMGRKLSDYLSIVLICPVLVIMASSVTVFIATQVELITSKFAFLGFFYDFIMFVLKFAPYFVLWVLFTFIYIFMPNTKVNIKSGIIAGIVAGTIYQLAQFAYIHLQVGVARYNAIYGSFAALPLFLIWLQLSWFIVLFGAELSFADQNVDTYEFEPDSTKVSYSFRRLLSLEILQLLIKDFINGKALTATVISHKLDIPIRLVRDILYDLVHCDIVSEVKTDVYKGIAFQPARDINDLSIGNTLKMLENKGVDDIPIAQTQELKSIKEKLLTLKESIEKSPSNVLLKDI